MARTEAQILQTIATAYAELAALKGAKGGAQASTGGGSDWWATGGVAPERELLSDKGDPLVGKDPHQKYWDGPSMVGKRYSECPSDYLGALASFKDYCANLKSKDAEKLAESGDVEGAKAKAKYADYDRKDAARARGWAKRNEGRDMSKPKADEPAPDSSGGDFGGGTDPDDEIPF